MSGALYLGIDVGTQGTKVLVVDRSGVVAHAASSYGLIAGLPPGAAEQHPDTWWQALRSCCAELARMVDLRRVKAVGVSGQQHGFVALDEQRNVIRPAKLWCDTSTSAEARELSTALGRSVPTGFTASKILWMKRREPEQFARLAHVLLPHDWINLRLTGRLAMEAGDASGTGLFDVAARDFDERACKAIDASLFAKLPELVPPDRPIGALTREAAQELGLPPGALVAPGSGDNMCAAIGAGAAREGVAVLSLGTSATLFAKTVRPVLDPESLIAPFCDATGAWLPLLCTMNATGVLHEVARAFSDLDLERLTQEAASVPAGCDGMLCLPFLQGERVPDLPLATGTLLGWRPGLLTPRHLFRAALEGIALNLAWGLARMRALGLQIDSVNLVGGGARNELWTQILSDVLGIAVRPLAGVEVAALGAAIQAQWVVKGGDIGIDIAPRYVVGGDSFQPDAQRRDLYRAQLERFREAVTRIYREVPGTSLSQTSAAGTSLSPSSAAGTSLSPTPVAGTSLSPSSAASTSLPQSSTAGTPRYSSTGSGP